MSTTQTVIEVVKFVSQGVPEIAAQTKAMNAEADETVTRYKALQNLVANPAYTRHAVTMEKLARGTELYNAKLRNAVATERLRDGSAARQLAANVKLNKEHERTQLKLRNVAAAQGLADGSTVKHIREVERLNKEHEKTQRIAEYTAKYGNRIGRLVEQHGAKLTMIGGALGGVAGTGAGLARQGFQGTVEQAKYDYEIHRLSREMASAMKPVMDLMTRGARAIRERMERLDGGGQDAVMGGILAGGTAAGAVAMHGASQMIGLVAGETMAAKLRSGFIRGGVGLAGAGALGYGLMAGNVTSGALGGAALGFSVGGLGGAVVGGIAGGVATQASISPKARPGETGMQYWNRMRNQEGKSWFGTYIAAQGEAISKAWDWATTNGKKRRDVQISGGGFDAPGTGFERVNAAISRQEGEKEPRDGPESRAETNKLVKAILDFLNDKKGATPLAREGG